MNKTTIRRFNRVKSKIKNRNISNRPIIYINLSNKNIYAQLIDCKNGNVITSFSSVAKSLKGTGIEKANVAGEEFSKKCLDSGVKNVVFFTGGKTYIGRVESFANACRKSGLNF